MPNSFMRTLLLALLFTSLCNAQTAIAFTDVEKLGITVKQLDETYKGALGEGGVFTTEEDQQKHTAAYNGYLSEFSGFLDKNDFKWDEINNLCFNRVYIAPDGKIDYFLYQFKTPITPEKEKEFNRLLNIYIKENRFGVTAPVKFSQCSPVMYAKE